MGEHSFEEMHATTKLWLRIKATLKPHQLEGLSFLVYLHKNGMSGILGDEMGLGKTLQTLSLFQHLKGPKKSLSNDENILLRPHLVICPVGVLSSWQSEAKKWTSNLRLLLFHGSKKERDRLKKVALGKEDWFGNKVSKPSRTRKSTNDNGPDLTNNVSLDDVEKQSFDIIVTSYETYEAERSWFRSAFHWRYAVLDEGHRIKNPATKRAKALQSIQAEHRLILTGTPIQNNLYELWSLLHWLYPDVFTDRTSELFSSAFDLSCGKADMSVMANARSLLELIMLRRTKYSPGINLDLPPKDDIFLFIPLSPIQRQWYERLVTRIDQDLQEGIFGTVFREGENNIDRALSESGLHHLDNIEYDIDVRHELDMNSPGAPLNENIPDTGQSSASNSWLKLMNIVLQLRKCCTHPFLIPGASQDSGALGRDFIEASGKFIAAEKLLKYLVLEMGKKVLIFSGFKEVLDYCGKLLDTIVEEKRFRYLRLDGGTSRPRRNLNLRLFADDKKAFKVMLVSTEAGGLGINLTAATEVIFMDEHWNPQVTLQAEARAHRIGQTKPVTVYKLCTQGTVEEQMLGRIRKKLYLSLKIVESMENKYSFSNDTDLKIHDMDSSDLPDLGVTQLMSLIRHGTKTLSHPQVDVAEMLSWDIDTMLIKCREKPGDLDFESTSIGRRVDEEEEKWLSQTERVECTILDGKRYERNRRHQTENLVLPPDVSRADRRIGKNVTVMVDGYAVSKDSLLCAKWEAVSSSAKHATQLEPLDQPPKDEFTSQSDCLCCWDGGELFLCSSCPRAYHRYCLPGDVQANLGGRSAAAAFYCPQHECFECEKRIADAGGLLFRCRWCPRAYCEICLDWDRAALLDDELPELVVLGYGPREPAYYVECPTCRESLREEAEWAAFITKKQHEFEAALRKRAEAGLRSDKMGEGDVAPVGERTPPHIVDSPWAPTPKTPSVRSPKTSSSSTPKTQSILTPKAPCGSALKTPSVSTPKLSIPTPTSGFRALRLDKTESPAEKRTLPDEDSNDDPDWTPTKKRKPAART